MSQQKYTIAQGISIGIGSIIGSGILFLPSMTLRLAGVDALLGWLLIIVLCIPGLYFLGEMVSVSTNDDGIAGFIGIGLGKKIGNAIPILLLGTVIFGMPSSTIIVGKYVQNHFETIPFIAESVPFIMILFSLITTLKGIKTSAIVNTFVSVLLVLVGIVLLLNSSLEVKSFEMPKFDFNLKNISNAALLAFWAFAGFENLTFLNNNFKNPKKDLLISAGVAILICGFLYLGLTYNISVLIPAAQIEQSTGLMQLADFVRPSNISKIIIVLFAFFAVMVNLISWTAGISMAVVSAAKNQMLPNKLGLMNDGIAKNASIGLCIIFCISISIGLLLPNYFETMLSLVSSNFLVLYFLSIVSYFKFCVNKIKKAFALILALIILVVLLSYKWLLIYPFVLLFLASYFSSKIRIRSSAGVA